MYKGNRELFGCSLDLSKAYDRVSQYRLFTKLLDAGCPVYFVKFLRHRYESQSMVVRWNGKLSSPFGVRNGVRQGRTVLSPSLFNMYIDDLLRQLKQSGDGARIGNKYVGALAYADDIMLLSSSILGLQRMLNVCGEYAEDHSLLFNEKKSTSIVFAKHKRVAIRNPELSLRGSTLQRVNYSLGHSL